MKYDVNVELKNRVEEYSFGSVAKQANGAAWLKSGDTVILATVVIDETEIVKDDFLPLTVQYIEKTYAAGKLPGGFFKRETKPSDFETLTSRIVDRSIRPLFPKGFGYPTQITILVFSADKESDLQVLALNAASAALYTSNIDINTSVSAVRAAKVDGALVLNPTLSELKNSTLDLYLSGTSKELLMIEMRSFGGEKVEVNDMFIDPMLDPTMATGVLSTHISNAMPEDELINVFEKAEALLFASNAKYEEQFASFKKETIEMEYKAHTINDEMVEYVRSIHLEDIKIAMTQMAKSERSTALRHLRKKILLEKEEWVEVELKDAIEKVKKEEVRAQILNERVRADGRALTEVRPITISTNVLPSAHSSCLFTRGGTQALVVLTMGGPKDAQMFETLTEEGTQNENFMVHYNFPGFSVGEASPIMGTKRRELGHGNLAKRALEPIVNLDGQTVRLVSEILESNGSSSMATVCGGYMALKAADIETSDVVAGIAMGMVSDGDRYAILSDIMGLEDHDGDMDFKVTGSKEGITAMQMDIKLGGVSLDVLKEALYQAKAGRTHIIDIMIASEKEIELNDGVLPSVDFFHIDPSFIGEIIGQAGKTIREMIEKFEVAIDIDKKDGKVKITGKNKTGVAGARGHIEGIVNSPKIAKIKYEVGDKHEGTVKKIVDFGAFIELPDGTDGLLHISKVADHKVEKVSDVLSEGEKISVEILEFKGNKISLGRA
ncbi:MAG: polyribonucleotide nucleotidyltransferase [Epsilonproteobacteria bacterium]|nr:polyribonucleotide nucleotidyltransferase [Campylobacterota bacterium]OIO16106.1 MAG: polyribonucleotide nucleotidyltransferase [Helicobacteraceae bacterium CG1_02_36_14]PIP10182.1 MAG: polyribonucleotide nucleotidyltransferase [Sulfurimonas sp. CG23_combo_of_CG06-09_8_20_14_all_36_33]PIS26498.1 MAG: polyribonucleotide nucleotidyltransferase [Sulfurimonas sp. CG08_land_8_20_14_0_20_36_33]PIU33960.1 MAG: polyribonucleotide nucleotidyltransferase [Sulfurimonas sp. CG07_land_8_20_14_0_80_36_56]